MSQFDSTPGKRGRLPNLKIETTRFAVMNFNQLEADPIAGPILQQMALEFLKTHDKEYFEREFTGKLDKRGYLIPRFDANFPKIKPSQNISGDRMAVLEVVRMTMEKLKEKYL